MLLSPLLNIRRGDFSLAGSRAVPGRRRSAAGTRYLWIGMASRTLGRAFRPASSIRSLAGPSDAPARQARYTSRAGSRTRA
jgi:hypothetical protein